MSGWGTLADKTCTTIDKGPAKHRRCKFPFVWMNHTHTTCSSSNPPSYYDENCKLLQNGFEDAEILDEKGDLITKCYHLTNSGLAGWCGTCVEGTRPSQPGFCPKRLRPGRWKNTPTEIEGHFGRPSTFENWGICSLQCLPWPQKLRATMLQVKKKLKSLKTADLSAEKMKTVRNG